MEIKVLSKEDIADFIALIRVFEKEFAMGHLALPKKTQLLDLLGQDNFMVIVARDNAIVIGGLTVYVLNQYYVVKPLAYVYDVAIKAEYQGKGIGKRLMAFLNNYCREQGFEEAFVQADKIDGHALDFYRKTNCSHEMDVVQFTYDLH